MILTQKNENQYKYLINGDLINKNRLVREVTQTKNLQKLIFIILLYFGSIFIHEIGHVICALLTGAKILDFTILFNSTYILYRVSASFTTPFSYSGGYFAMFILLFILPQKSWMRKEVLGIIIFDLFISFTVNPNGDWNQMGIYTFGSICLLVYFQLREVF